MNEPPQIPVLSYHPRAPDALHLQRFATDKKILLHCALAEVLSVDGMILAPSSWRIVFFLTYVASALVALVFVFRIAARLNNIGIASLQVVRLLLVGILSLVPVVGLCILLVIGTLRVEHDNASKKMASPL